MKNRFITASFCSLAVFLTLAIGCANNKDASQEKEPGVETADSLSSDGASVVFEQQRFYRAAAPCATDSTHCATMEAVYPMAVGGPDQAVKNINDSIGYYVKRTLAVFAIEPGEIALPLDEIAQNYLDEYRALTTESIEYAIPWTVETHGKVLYHTERVASIELENYSFTGGAHPNSVVLLQSFDLTSGHKLGLEDIVTDLERLEAMVEQKFREVRELDAATDLAEAGFFWGDAFTLPENYALTKEGLYFYYNPYEAAAYALGPTEFTLTKEELGDLLKEF